MADELIDSTDGVRLRLLRLGPDRTGTAPPTAPAQAPTRTVIVFAHATGFCADVWAPMAAEPPLAGFPGVALDFRAHGRSGRPDDGDLRWSGMADDVLAVIDALGWASDQTSDDPTRIVGAGHSMGGAALLLAEQRRPGTFAALWCMEPIVFPPEFLDGAGGGSSLSDGAARRRATFESPEVALENFSSKPPLNALRADALAAYVSGGFEPQPDGSVTLRCRPADESQLYLMGARHDAWNGLERVECPTVVVRGRVDPPGPATIAGSIVERLPRGRLVDAPTLGHFAPMEDPAAMAMSLREMLDSL